MDVIEAKRAILQEYEKDYAELGLMIARLRRELGMTGVPASSSTGDPAPSSNGLGTGKVNVIELVSPGDFFGMTQVLAVRYLLDRAQQPASLRDIAHATLPGQGYGPSDEGPGRCGT